jgi:vancomycin resistance protein YoaR
MQLQANTKTKIELSAIIMVAIFAFALSNLEFAKAAPFDQQPVPTYSPVTSTGGKTTATIPANLVTEWRGLYSRPVGSVIGRTEKISGVTFEQFLQSVVFNKTAKQPSVTYKYNPAAVYVWTGQIANAVNAPASEPAMKIENGRVTEFTPPQTGKVLDRYASTMKIMESLGQGVSVVELSVNASEPKESLGALNDLGITELIGRGESKFNGSPANRRWNIKVGVKKMTGIIVKPGEEFSFNKYLGPVEASTGFKPELVIKAEGTVPEFGGGLCQVSSTTFRAAMHAGLPITQRRNHSYAVQYYAPQGTDATIYPGVIDLKFTNDTGNSILIWPYFKDDNYLVFDFYGTYDGRKVELGTPYAYDKKSNGAMKATWKRTVTRVGEEPKYDVFASNYQPPALFHKQESFVPATPPPGTNPATDPAPSDTTPDTTTPPTNSNGNSNSNSSSNSNSDSALEPEQNN